jgi:hypothetical protein
MERPGVDSRAVRAWYEPLPGIADTSRAGRRPGDVQAGSPWLILLHDRQAIKVARSRFGRSEATEQVQVT